VTVTLCGALALSRVSSVGKTKTLLRTWLFETVAVAHTPVPRSFRCTVVPEAPQLASKRFTTSVRSPAPVGSNCTASEHVACAVM
jgi:hypothetical protein